MPKVLIAGDVKGQIDAFAKRVNTVNSKHGPFDAVLCAGDFLGGDDAQLAAYTSGQKSLPLPTYFIAGGGELPSALAGKEEGGELCANLSFLGLAGTQTIAGAHVMFLSGDPSTEGFTERARGMVKGVSDPVDLLLSAVWPAGVLEKMGGVETSAQVNIAGGGAAAIVGKAASMVAPRYHFAGGGGVFFQRHPYRNLMGEGVTRFLGLGQVGTKEKWVHALSLKAAGDMTSEERTAEPAGTTGCPYGTEAARPRPPAAAPPAKRAKAMPQLHSEMGNPFGIKEDNESQPWRYNIPKYQQGGGKGGGKASSKHSVFVANISFRLDENGLGQAFEHCGEIVNVRIATDLETGRAKGHGWIDFKEEAGALKAIEMNGADVAGRQVRVDWGTRSSQNAGPAGERKAPQNQLMGGSVSDCWFCLSNPEADLHLLASILEHAYLAVDKGPIVPDHVLVIPIDHQPCSAVLPAPALTDVEKYVAAFRQYCEATGRVLVMFERFMTGRKDGGNHCHFNLIPVPKEKAGDAEAIFRDTASENGFEFEVKLGPAGGVEAQALLKQEVGEGPFLCVTLPDGGRLVHPILAGERHSMGYARDACCLLLGQPDRADWRNCKLDSQDQEAQAAEAFKTRFGKFDPAAA